MSHNAESVSGPRNQIFGLDLNGKCWEVWDTTCGNKAITSSLHRSPGGERRGKRKRWTIFLQRTTDRGAIGQTNLGTDSKATLGTLLRDGGWVALARAAKSIFFSLFFCVATKTLLREDWVSLAGAATSIFFCHDKSFARDKYTLVATKECFVTTKLYLSRQKYTCRDKNMIVGTDICHGKRFVTTSIFLSRQKTCFVAANICLSFCRDKNYTCGSSRQW